MELEKTLRKSLLKDQTYFLAISGGVDSMVLLDILLKMNLKPHLLHVNYGLRKEAATETDFLKKYVKEKNLTLNIKYFKEDKFTEEIGRHFRYEFFKENLTEKSILLTAHHLDDLGETFLMKVTRGTQLKNLAFLKTQPFGKGTLYRPLLPFPKEELYAYAKKHELTYFEDASNEDLTYTRNRYRKEILPLLKKENPQVLKHFYQLNEELTSLEFPKLQGKFSLSLYKLLPENFQKSYFDLWLKEEKLFFSPEEKKQLHSFLNKKTYGTLVLKDKTLQVKEDTLVFFEKNPQEILPFSPQVLSLNTWVKLSATEKVGLFQENYPISWPQEGKCYFISIYEPVENLVIRHPEQGDVIKLKKEGYTKKLRRYFIDEKIPQEIRQNQWVVADKFKNILWMIPNGKSYLSYQGETAKMFYRLIYINTSMAKEIIC